MPEYKCCKLAGKHICTSQRAGVYAVLPVPGPAPAKADIRRPAQGLGVSGGRAEGGQNGVKVSEACPLADWLGEGVKPGSGT